MRFPDRIGKYQVHSLLGRGGMGTVYRCIDPDLNRYVAVKLLHVKASADQLDSMQRRFLREALTTAQLQHPGIPPVYDVGQDSEHSHLYYVMKPLEGRSLREILQELRDDTSNSGSGLDLFRLVEILRDVARTLQYAHSHGYLHRDIKPGNILVGDYGEVYVMDWGLTKALTECTAAAPADSSASAAVAVPEVVDPNQTVVFHDTPPPLPAVDGNMLTVAGSFLGTVAYMAPEQAVAQAQSLGPETDLYALGVILYEMLTLQLPVREHRAVEMIKLKQQGKILAPELQAPDRDVPPELAAVCMQAMQVNPLERFRSAQLFCHALEFWLEGKTQFRRATPPVIGSADLLVMPRNTRSAWQFQKDAVTTMPFSRDLPTYALFTREFHGDVRFTVNVLARPEADGKTISEFALVLAGVIPQPWRGFVDGYSVHFAASRNTRAYLARNGTEVLSSEYLMLEPRRRYRLSVEWRGNAIYVNVNHQLVLFYQDSDPLAGGAAGFLHCGDNIAFNDVRVYTRGAPTRVMAIEVPEALMAEECYKGALKRFLAIAQAHPNRREGAWARYRAGIASYSLDQDRRKALQIWEPLKKGPYAVYEQLGRANLELLKNRPLQAAKLLMEMVARDKPPPHLGAVADIAFTQVQQRLRRAPVTERDWDVLDAWARLALLLGQRLQDRQSITPSVLWQWLMLALTRYPHHLSGCLAFLRKSFGCSQGAFAKTLTAIDPLMTILRRSVGMTDQAFLRERVMRLILNYDDNLGNLETLVSFYLYSGHLEVALTLSRHICAICRRHECRIPPVPIALLACTAWLRKASDAPEFLDMMLRHSEAWAVPDAKLLAGLEHYAHNDTAAATQLWQSLRDNPEAVSYNRHLAARGLLGELPPDPVAANVPNRSDHRLVYCLFLGFRHLLDWRRHGADTDRATAIRLLEAVLDLTGPSYDIYSATDLFARLPLAELKHTPAQPPLVPEPLSDAEHKWLQQLTAVTANLAPEKHRRASSGGKVSTPA